MELKEFFKQTLPKPFPKKKSLKSLKKQTKAVDFYCLCLMVQPDRLMCNPCP